MNDEKTIIDLKFGVAQLGGNQDLLIKLLVKFQTQYTDLTDKLDMLFIQGDIAAAKGHIHTLKGVTGNLGLNAVHMAAKRLETSLSLESDHRSALSEFKSVLTKTLVEITSLAQQSNSNKPTAKDGLSQLKDSLMRNEYISPDKLGDYLSQSDFSASVKNEISQAIEELDYPTALTLLKSN